ncbi:tyrosine-type recombinase/integrase [Nonomuraea cypriaca]|uniref:tyrosine-type recombinase/integrase n=1 Tax=Nonomuraea cypriaca TaxID=1187855 RepID=UPI001F376687|nr:tyrosine-type recombinase/integrase [Nonomuraea cypriaca]
MNAAPKITALRGGGVTLVAAADAFLATSRTANPNTHRAYASAIDRTIERLGRDRPLAEVTDAEVGHALAELWGGERAGDLEPQPCRRHLLADLVPDQEALGRPVGPGRGRTPQGERRRDPPGLDLHQLRHSAATHLGDAEIPLQLIMGKTRHKNPRTAMRYVKPGAEAIAKVTEVLAPRRRTH